MLENASQYYTQPEGDSVRQTKALFCSWVFYFKSFTKQQININDI